MRRDGREFISGSESPRKFSEVLAERPIEPDDRAPIADLPGYHTRALLDHAPLPDRYSKRRP